jgi:hypothetical protein
VSIDEIVERVQRIYAAVDATIEGDLTKFTAKRHEHARGFTMGVDFTEGVSPAELSNVVHSVIHNIANLEDHLCRWAKKNGQDPHRIEQVVSSSSALRILKDLSNNDKHGYPPGRSHSGKAPRITDVEQFMRLGGNSDGESAQFWFNGGTGKSGSSGPVQVMISAEVVDARGIRIGDLRELETEALAIWERELEQLGISL